MQNKLVNTDESINIDELEKSKTISLTSNRSPALDYSATGVLYLVKSVSCLTFYLVKSSPLQRHRFNYAGTVF